MTGLPTRLLMGSGPSTVPDRVLTAMAQPTLGHLDPAFLALAEDANALLRSAFRTANPTTFSVSGTGSAGMETMIANFLEPGDRLVVGVCGLFGERIVDAAQRLGVCVSRVDAPWGEPVDYARLEPLVGAGTRALAVVHGETSTGVAQPLEGLAELAHDHDALFMVDCVTSLGGHPLEIDDAGVDVAFSATQKCLNCPPGLAPMTLSDRALERLAARRTRVASWCFDLPAILEYWDSRTRVYHHTPPINSIYALHEALMLVLETGLETRWREHAAASAALLVGLEPLGARGLVRAEHRLWPLTTVVPPPEVDEAAIRHELLERHGMEIAGGLGALAGRAWRIGTMGVNASLKSVTAVVEAIATALGESSSAVADACESALETWSATIRAADPHPAGQGAP